MKKFNVMWLALAAMLMLISCTVKQSQDDEHGSIAEKVTQMVANTERIVLQESDGYIDSILEQVPITKYRSSVQTANILTAPSVYLDDEYTYVIRNFPEEIMVNPEMIELYQYDLSHVKQIEIYKHGEFDIPIQTIPLSDTEDEKIMFYGLSRNEDKSYSLFGNVIKESGFNSVLFRYSEEGDLLNQNVVKVSDYTHLALIDDSVIYIDRPITQNLPSGQLKKLDAVTGNEVIIADSVMYFCQENSTLYYITRTMNEEYETELTLWRYDVVHDETVSMGQLQISADITSFGYDSSFDILYYVLSDQIYAYRMSDGSSVWTAVLENGIPIIRQYSGARILLNNGNHQMLELETVSNPGEKYLMRPVLRICNRSIEANSFYLAHKEALIQLAKNGVPVRVEEVYTVENTAEYANTMAKKLLANDENFDLFVVESTASDLLVEQYYEDLSSYPQLMYYMDSMVSGAENLAKIGGRLALIPYAPRIWNANYAKDWYALGLPYPMTLNEMAEIDLTGTDKYLMSAGTESKLISMWFEQIVSNYMDDIITDESAEQDIILVVDTIKSMRNQNRIYVGNGDAAVLMKRITYNSRYGDTIAPFPRVREEYRTAIHGVYYAINPNSDQKELSALILSYILEVESANQSSVSWLFDFNYKDQADTVFKSEIANSIRMYSSSQLMDELVEGLQAVDAGEIKVNEMAENLVKIMKFMKKE